MDANWIFIERYRSDLLDREDVVNGAVEGAGRMRWVVVEEVEGVVGIVKVAVTGYGGGKDRRWDLRSRVVVSVISEVFSFSVLGIENLVVVSHLPLMVQRSGPGSSV